MLGDYSIRQNEKKNQYFPRIIRNTTILSVNQNNFQLKTKLENNLQRSNNFSNA